MFWWCQITLSSLSSGFHVFASWPIQSLWQAIRVELYATGMESTGAQSGVTCLTIQGGRCFFDGKNVLHRRALRLGGFCMKSKWSPRSWKIWIWKASQRLKERRADKHFSVECRRVWRCHASSCGVVMCQRCQNVSTPSGNGALGSTVSQRAQGAPTQSTRSASGCLVE